MAKIRNCSTWNKAKKFIISAFCSLSILGTVVSPVAFGAPAVVAVAPEAVGALLVALGLMAGDAVSGYTWNAFDDPYTSSIFESEVGGITSGVPKHPDELGHLLGTVIPENVYTTDGELFYTAGKTVTTNDLYVMADSMVDKSFIMPVNVEAVQGFVSYDSTTKRCVVYSPLGSVNTDSYFIPYFVGVSGSTYILPQCFHFESGEERVRLYDYIKKNETAPVGFSGTGFYDYMSFAPVYYDVPAYSSNNRNGYGEPVFELFRFQDPATHNYSWSGFQLVSGSGADFESGGATFPDLDPTKVSSGTLLQTTGEPLLALQGDKTSLDNAIVQVKPPEDDHDNKETPPTPQTPNKWEIWKTAEDLIRYIETGDPTNGGTDFQQYVNNNYNYVDVDINVPDTINNNVNISGGLDINGSGDITVTVHEDISLPSGGDGSGFFNPDATDVVDAIGKSNPVVSVISGIFSAIDPALLGIFSVSVSLLLVLGLWKLIRG